MSDVPQDKRADYIRLLAEYEDTFSTESNDIGFTDVTQHNIKLPQGPNGPASVSYTHLTLPTTPYV